MLLAVDCLRVCESVRTRTRETSFGREFEGQELSYLL